ncbi:aspartate--tRNA ligase [Patescibacteria group bacterium]|nr:aspartate--tRNA ligase [Patescibacteria group bacterium]
MERISIKDAKNKIGETVKLAGWVDVRRDHGKLIFVDLRDASAKVQMVVTPDKKEIHKTVETIRPEWVIEIEGKVNKRPEKMINLDLLLGEIEIEVEKINILNSAKTPPFEIETDGYDVDEEIRLKYRYLDLRRERLQKNLRVRHEAIKFIRDYLSSQNFIEVETPLLTKSTPEGARDFVVPSRLQPGKFYALPQAPQQYKQLLMASGIEKYFQIAKCLRDEDTRGDRQPEFTQLDLEMSFVEKEDILKLNEQLIIDLVKKIMPSKKIQAMPFPRLSYKEAMEKYDTDRPDLRDNKNDSDMLAFCWIIDFPMFKKTDKGEWTFTHNPFSASRKEDQQKLLNKKDIDKIIAEQYDLILNGFEIGGGSIRNHQSKLLKSTLEIIGLSDKNIKENFNHMLEAFEYGAPPHGGIAFGIDRFIAILQNEPNIREVIAFPKTGDARDLMMSAPSEISKEQLKELGLEIKKKK